MIKYINYGFTLNISKPKKESKPKNKRVVSRKCLCVVIKDSDETLKAKIINSPSISEAIIIPFTDRSFELNGKEYVFTKSINNNNNKRTLVIRNKLDTSLIQGDSRNEHSCYSPIVENIVLSGYIIKTNNRMYFDYDNFIAFKEGNSFFNSCNINEEEPLFK